MSKHVVIIGGGVIGLCAAWYSRQRGHRVTICDRNSPERDGCSFGNAGMIVPSHVVPLAAPGMVSLGLKCLGRPDSPFAVEPRCSWDLLSWGVNFWRASTAARVQRAAPLLRDLNMASRGLYEELAENWGNEFGLTRRGLLMLCQEQATLDEEAHAAELAKSLGLPVEILDRASAAKHDPEITMDIAGGILFPADCHLSPGLLMASLQRRLVEAGCEFHWNCDVQGLLADGGQARGVATSKGTISADEVVLAGGVWSARLARSVGLRLPLQPGRGYSLTLEQPRRLPQLCSIGVEGRIAITPMGSRLRVGGTMELGSWRETINPRRVRGIITSFCRYFPEFSPDDFASSVPWQGLRPCSPDGLPYLGRTRRCQNLIVAAGHAMMGLSLGPITGQLVAQLASGDAPAMDLTLLSPDRYGPR